MIKKKCPIDGTEYEEGTYSDAVHDVILCTKEEVQNKLKILFDKQRVHENILHFSGLLNELKSHCDFKKVKTIETFKNLIDRWTSIALEMAKLSDMWTAPL